MKNLQELYLSGNEFVGPLPLCLGSLKKLRLLDLSYNKLSGNLSSSFSSLESLEYLSLSDNNFEGFFSLDPLANLTKLKVLKLSSASDIIQVDTESTWLPKFQLTIAALPFCGLERIPNFLMYQKKLRVLDLSSNRISGNIPTWLLANNPELEVLQLQNNTFTIFEIPTTILPKLQFLDFSANDIGGVLPDYFGHVLPSLLHVNGTHNELQGNLPSSMGEMKNISFLDLSHNNFSGELPRSLFTGCVSLQILKLSHNRLGGHILPSQTNLTSLIVLRMDNNLFTGEIGMGLLTLTNLSVLDASNNRLTGAIPGWLPESSHMIMLLLSNNLLEGTLPPSLLAVYHLEFLDLSGNLLSGELPSSQVNSMYGISMFLHNNSLTGPIPVKLLENAKILDLGKNKLSGSIPQFVNTGEMRIFLLKGNNLTGSIPRTLCDVSNIKLLDLSDNKLNGTIPSCLYNVSFGLGEEEEMRSGPSVAFRFGDGHQFELYKSTFLLDEFRVYYDTFMIVEIQFAAKQRYDSYTGGTLDYMYGLDLSTNELSGVIPAELGELSKIRAMNLSRNFLWSSIPDSFSKLKDIESLDLSFNMLHGNIPSQLTNLTSLAVFNVSYNNLSGIIPQGRQFSTFNENSYLGNPLLCGPPTDKSCNAKKSTKEADNGGEEDDDEAIVDMLVFYWSTGSTFVTALIGFLLLMCIDCPWRRAWLRLVDAFTASAKRIVLQVEWMSTAIIHNKLRIVEEMQLLGYKSCVENERKALLELKKYIFSITKEEKSGSVFPTWTDDTKSDFCLWEGVVCNQTSRRVTKIAFGTLDLKENSLLNLSLLHPFEDVRSLNLSKSRFSFLDPEEDRGWHELKDNQFAGLFDVVEGYRSLGRLRNLEILDFTSNKFNNSIFPFINSATSLTTLFLRDNHMDGPFPAKELRDLIKEMLTTHVRQRP
ncbi:hypothetical protein Bca101_027720 [Brassica carinata]